MKKVYFVTGGTGFIGSAIVKKLSEEGHSIVVLDNDWRGNARRLSGLKGDIDIINADIRDSNSVCEASKNADSIIHLAYVNGTENFYQSPDLVMDVAVRGMLSIVDACQKNNVKEFVLASSSEVYQSPNIIPTNESVQVVVPDIYNPRYSYGGGKIACELMTTNMVSKLVDKTLIFRPHNVYGPDMGFEHVIPQLAMKLIQIKHFESSKDEVKILGSGEQTRAFCYIDDFIQGVHLLLTQSSPSGLYHIGTPSETSIMNLCKLMMSRLGLDLRVKTSVAPKGETDRRVPDVSKIKQLGFKPAVNLDQGLEKTIPWYQEYCLQNK